MAESTSYLVWKFLVKKAVGWEFNTKTLQAEIPDASPGGLSGYLSKLLATGAIRTVTRNTRNGTYATVDMGKAYTPMKSRPVRRVEGVNRRDLSNRLLEIASAIEGIKSPLADYSTEEIMAELTKRMKGN